MPRPKGSKNKKTLAAALTPEAIGEKLAAAEREITALEGQLRAKKSERRALVKAGAEAARIAAQKQAEQEKAQILAAVEHSEKSVAEILEFLK